MVVELGQTITTTTTATTTTTITTPPMLCDIGEGCNGFQTLASLLQARIVLQLLRFFHLHLKNALVVVVVVVVVAGVVAVVEVKVVISSILKHH